MRSFLCLISVPEAVDNRNEYFPFFEHFSCAGHCAMFMESFSNNYMREVYLLFSAFRFIDSSIKRLKKLLKVTQIVSKLGYNIGK